MSRSRRHEPVTGFACSTSEKGYKKDRQGRERTAVRQALRLGLLIQDADINYELIPWNEWVTARDGKMRFDPIKYPKLMRK